MPDTTTSPSGDDARPRVFISYTQETDAHIARVRGLAERLRGDGVNAQMDKYLPRAPKQGWPLWMHEEIERADFVLVVCTATYERRALGREVPEKGLGGTWEGAIITQTLYEDQGRNEKFIPVVFDDGDARHIPFFLRPTTRYRVTDEAQYDALFGVLTNQPDVHVPPLGPLRRRAGTAPHPDRGGEAPPQSTTGRRGGRDNATAAPRAEAVSGRGNAFAGRTPVMLRFEDGNLAAFGAERIEAGQTLALDLVALTPEGAAHLQALRAATGPSSFRQIATVAVAYGAPPTVEATWARVREVGQSIAGGTTRWQVTLEPEARPAGLGDETAINNYSADDIAELRARRILLDERASRRAPGDPRPGVHRNEARLDSFVDGVVSGGMGLGRVGRATLAPVDRSPLPALFAEWTGDREAFLAAARLTATMWLVLTQNVEQVRRLDLAFTGDDTLRVAFHGARRKFYTNQPAPEITVTGDCPPRP